MTTQVPPTTVYEQEGKDPDRDIGTTEDLAGNDEDEVCGAELSKGGTCDRPAGECPYHGEGGDDGA